MPRQRKYSDDELIEAVKASTSIRQVLQKLGKAMQGGGSYDQIQHDCKRLNLSTSHFTGKGHLKGKTHSWAPKRPLAEVLVVGCFYNRTCLKKRLLKENLLRNECYECGQLPEWNGKKLVMVLDHINGVNDDNRLDNLRLLCPNCNSQTETFAGRNRLLV